ncbi:ABC transporter permease (plasmid) [Catenovulum sp. SX2]|uniref:ABC transporter permease n=1 Tax=Catenovulum sp. SX2 TaxID=3398614 RepID=UPI003F873AE8
MNISKLPVAPIISALMRHKISAMIIIAQIALTLAIVSNALFITQQRMAMIERDTGLKESGLFMISVNGDKENADPMRDIQALRAVPSISHASVTNSIPVSGAGTSSGLTTSPDDGSQDSTTLEGASAGLYFTDHNFIDSAGLELIAGRNFRKDEVGYAQDQQQLFSSTFSVIVTQAFAKELVGDENIVGKTLYQGTMPVQVVGVVKKLQSDNPKWEIAERAMLVNQVFLFAPQIYLVRTDSQDIQAVMQQAKQALAQVNPTAVISDGEAYIQMKKRFYSRDYLLRNVLLALVIALLLITALGIIGMTLFNINRRIKEIGTRRALGASKQDILVHFMLENIILLFVGLVLGTALAMVLNNQLIEHFALAKLPIQQLVWTLVSILVLGQLATFWPALRAASISPAIATRTA